MGRVRRCNSRCHNAKKPRCRCWCGGYFHGANGASNRTLMTGFIDNPRGIALMLLKEHGFKESETAYIEQKELPLEEPKTRKECLERMEKIKIKGGK